jgi:hypothetical protein
VEKDTISGVLRYNNIPIAVATMGYEHRQLPADKMLASLTAPNFLLACASSLLAENGKRLAHRRQRHGDQPIERCIHFQDQEDGNGCG